MNSSPTIFDSLRPLIDVFAVLGLLVLVVAVVLFLLRGRMRAPIFPYATKPVLSDAEGRFFHVLMRSLPEGTILLSKVRLADFLEVTRAAGEERLGHFGRISQKHADFLVVDSETHEPLAVVELDDSTHSTSRRTVESDAFKNDAFAAAGLSIVRFPVRKSYDAEVVAQTLEQALADTIARQRSKH